MLHVHMSNVLIISMLTTKVSAWPSTLRPAKEHPLARQENAMGTLVVTGTQFQALNGFFLQTCKCVPLGRQIGQKMKNYGEFFHFAC